VLEHGKSHERSAIIKELAGKIVQMSQQKFASNVVEKCLTFSGPAERQILVNEMLGTTDENEPLQVCNFCALLQATIEEFSKFPLFMHVCACIRVSNLVLPVPNFVSFCCTIKHNHFPISSANVFPCLFRQ